MSTPALNPLVEKIRGAHPGAYDDMDDATLTKRVLAKYPQYSDLAAPPLQQPVQVESSATDKAMGALAPQNVPRTKGAGSSQEGMPGFEGSYAANDPDKSAAMTATGFATAGAMAAKPVAGVLSRMMAEHPILSMAAIEAAKQLPYVGKYAAKIPSWLPLMAGKSPAAVEGAEAAEGEALGPAAPEPALTKSTALAKANTPASRPAAETGEALGQPPQRGSIAQAMKTPETTPAAQQSAATPPAPKPITRGSLSQMMQEQLEKGLGARKLDPKTPLRQQMDTSPLKTPDIPEGHISVNSSALRSYKYDPAGKEFHARYSSGDATTHVFGDVDPEEAQAFDQAESKGKAMQQIKQGHPLVAKIVNGKRLSVISSK